MLGCVHVFIRRWCCVDVVLMTAPTYSTYTFVRRSTRPSTEWGSSDDLHRSILSLLLLPSFTTRTLCHGGWGNLASLPSLLDAVARTSNHRLFSTRKFQLGDRAQHVEPRKQKARAKQNFHRGKEVWVWRATVLLDGVARYYRNITKTKHLMSSLLARFHHFYWEPKVHQLCVKGDEGHVTSFRLDLSADDIK